eukprot:1160200-Pelagomonas_calceolata.AAC.9
MQAFRKEVQDKQLIARIAEPAARVVHCADRCRHAASVAPHAPHLPYPELYKGEIGWCIALTDADLQHLSHLTRLTCLTLSYTKVRA